MKKVVIYTDGACARNPGGPGGWAAVLVYGTHRRELSGSEASTTNNRMELRAAIEALVALKESCEIECHTDSQYLRQGVTQWLKGWKRNGWQTVNREPVKNVDLWQALDAEVARHRMTWHWLRGHAGHRENERCDALARAAIEARRRR